MLSACLDAYIFMTKPLSLSLSHTHTHTPCTLSSPPPVPPSSISPPLPYPPLTSPPPPQQMVNIQANDTFASHQLNRDTWSDPAVGEIVKNNFVFVQIMAESGFGQSVCGAYRVTETPIIMVVDPETRAKVKQWTGFLAPDRCGPGGGGGVRFVYKVVVVF